MLLPSDVLVQQNIDQQRTYDRIKRLDSRFLNVRARDIPSLDQLTSESI
jgi:hypothetical protein